MRPQTETIGIIGGRGKMGQWFARLFDSLGLKTIISDLGTSVSNQELVTMTKIIVVSVPMEAFEGVVKEIGPMIPEDGFLTDLCSLKERQVACMLENTRCSVCGTHPLFGPLEDSISGRRVAICPGRGDDWMLWWAELLKGAGAKTFLVDAASHDRHMAWVQALNHFILMSLGGSIKKAGLDTETLKNLTTPSFEQQMKIVERLKNQDPELYATIQFANPHTKAALKAFMKEAGVLLDCIVSGDRQEFLKRFREVQAFG